MILLCTVLLIFFLIGLLFHDFRTLCTNCDSKIKQLKQLLFDHERRMQDSLKSNSQCCHSGLKDTRERTNLLVKRIEKLEKQKRENDGSNGEAINVDLKDK